MAEKRFERKVTSVVLQNKRRPSSSTAEKSKRVELNIPAKHAPGPAKTLTDDLFAKEEKYKLVNAELEAKTADLVRQAEQLMREHSEVLSKPLSNVLFSDFEDDDDLRITESQPCTVQDPGVKVTSQARKISAGKQGKKFHSKREISEECRVDDDAAAEETADSFLAKTIQHMEDKMSDASAQENVMDDVSNAEDNIVSGASHVQIRVFKAKLRIMQEELDQRSCEYYKKDDENAKLSARIKELEEDRAKLQKNTNILQTQIEKHRGLAEDSAKKSDGLQLQVSALHKEIDNLNRSQKQAAAVHNTVEVRLNRALEEVERLKTQLNQAKQMNKDKISEEQQSKENLLAENNTLKKQKAELIVGFKKQLKLIDILKKQKMHFEAAKLLSFTEDEFMKALDWGKS
ncbi:testis-expressed protein 9 [Melanotaenia boesemani]|uniref:testis-expressed protein 9 n=1 Tax=Melanotaenia boesemani TaxID=1250792 RepID=UPI001C044C58|nr:testis-expressed protein 9 [Melanotaenia boesemani]